MDADGVTKPTRKTSASVATAAEVLVLDKDRFFDPEPSVRRVARELFGETQALPIMSPHGHMEARLLAEDTPFPDPAALFITPDHYVLRMLYSRGVALEALGVPRRRGSGEVELDPRRIWQRFAERYYLFRGTPSAVWLDYQFHEVFGIRVRLTADTAARIYDEIQERLAAPEFRPRALFNRFNIDVLATTDAPDDSLEHHAAIARHRLVGGSRVIPTFRPDRVFRIARREWRAGIDALAAATGSAIETYDAFIHALETRRAFFKTMGATATDHGVVEPLTAPMRRADVEQIFQRGLLGDATAEDQRRFEANLLMEMARMSVADGLVMQLHAGSWRDHNALVAEDFGPDRGGDIPVVTEFTRNLRRLLNAHGNDPRFRFIVFTLDESTYSRELAPLAGHYPAMLLGAPWWFHDSIEGITRFREATTETAGIYNTAGFNDDTRAFCSIPARHDLSRRVDANWLARQVARHVISMTDAREMIRALTYDLVKAAYRL
jgi:glucuronate isomerase